MDSFLPIFSRGTLDITLQELREPCDGPVSALMGNIQIREIRATEQIHSMQQSPLLQQLIERLSREQLHATTQRTPPLSYVLGERLARDAGRACQMRDNVLENRYLDSLFLCVEIELGEGDDGGHS